MKAFIFNADDLGCSTRTDKGIIEAARVGVVNCASLLVTGPRAAESHALAVDAGLEIGLHLNLTSEAWADPRDEARRELLRTVRGHEQARQRLPPVVAQHRRSARRASPGVQGAAVGGPLPVCVRRCEGAPRGAVGSGGVRDPAAGLSQRAGEAEGSLISELRVRVGAALTTTGRGRRSDRVGPASKADRCNESEPVIEPPQATTPGLETDGCGLGHAERGAPEISRAPRPPAAPTPYRSGSVASCCVIVTAGPQGKSWAPLPPTEQMVNVGTVRLPTSLALSGWTVRCSVRLWCRAGRSLRSSPSWGKPGTWRRQAAGLRRPSGRRGGRR
jgi:hypothetical protein